MVADIDYLVEEKRSYSQDDYHFGFPLYPNAPVAGRLGVRDIEWRMTIEHKSSVRIRFTKRTLSGWVLCARGAAGSIFSTPIPMVGLEMRESDVYDTYEEALKAYEQKCSELSYEMVGTTAKTIRSVDCDSCGRSSVWRQVDDGTINPEWVVAPGFCNPDEIEMLPWLDFDAVFRCNKCLVD